MHGCLVIVSQLMQIDDTVDERHFLRYSQLT